MKNLTEREAEALNVIMRYRETNGYSPSWREIGKAMFIESDTAVQRYLFGLCEKGYITITPKVARSIVVNITL